MPSWITYALWAAGAALTVISLGKAIHVLVVRPIDRFVAKLGAWLARIAAASDGVERVAREVQGLSGAVVRLVVAIVDDQTQLRQEHDELRQSQSELVRLVVDLDAETHRLRQMIEGKPRRETTPPT